MDVPEIRGKVGLNALTDILHQLYLKRKQLIFGHRLFLVARQNPARFSLSDICTDPVFQSRRIVHAIVVWASPVEAFADPYGCVDMLVCALALYILGLAGLAIGLPVLVRGTRQAMRQPVDGSQGLINFA